MCEGFDLQAAGLAAPKFSKIFELTAGQLGWVFSANSIGLFIGAAFGGFLADRSGRRLILIASMLTFGFFSLATALAPNPQILVLMRLLTGLGLGGAMPNLIALCAETGDGQAATRVTLLTAGVPLGAAFGSLYVFASGPELDWRQIFYVGGIAPVVVAFIMIFNLPESSAFLFHARNNSSKQHAHPANTSFALFGEERAMNTAQLWTAGFFTLVILYILINWLPVLLIDKGLTRMQATLALMAFSFGGSAGAVTLGFFMARISQRLVMLVTYSGIGLSLVAMANLSRSPELLAIGAFMLGFFIVGAQYLLYGLMPTHYPVEVRGLGVGWSVAVGRVGAIAGPAAAGALLAAGLSASQLLGALMPIVVLALIAVLALISKPNRPTRQ
jgi:AAHS family 3-hydroxyphenylpropionic acid transporter